MKNEGIVYDNLGFATFSEIIDKLNVTKSDSVL